MNKFLGILVNNESWCGLSYGSKKFRYESLEQVQASVRCLADNNVHSGEKELRGKFKGFLPMRRTFEFLPIEETDRTAAIYGKIDPGIEEPDILNRDWLEKLVVASFHTIQIGRGKPRYTLKSLTDLSLQ